MALTPPPTDPGLRIAFIELFKILCAKGILDSNDRDQIIRLLTELSAAYEMKPSQRASVEELSKSMVQFLTDDK